MAWKCWIRCMAHFGNELFIRIPPREQHSEDTLDIANYLRVRMLFCRCLIVDENRHWLAVLIIQISIMFLGWLARSLFNCYRLILRLGSRSNSQGCECVLGLYNCHGFSWPFLGLITVRRRRGQLAMDLFNCHGLSGSMAFPWADNCANEARSTSHGSVNCPVLSGAMAFPWVNNCAKETRPTGHGFV
jgi:hypothetical protein